jgi:putative tryptophan/tyrosine transport system substrate-binding protein
VSNLSALEVKRATTTIPIVFANAQDPVGQGLVESLAHPGGNATGLSLMAIDLSGKRLELLKQAVPSLLRVALLVDPTGTFKERMIKSHQTAAEALGISLWPVEILKPDDIEPVFAKMAQDRADGVIRGTGTMLFIERARVGAPKASPASDKLRRGGGSARPSDVVWTGHA